MVDGTTSGDIEPLPKSEQVSKFNPNTWTFATDANGDLILNEKNQFALTQGQHAIALHLKVALASAIGEDPVDDDYGLDVNAAVNTHQTLKRELRDTLDYDDFRHDRIDGIPTIDIHGLDGQRSGLDVDITVRLADGDDPLTFMFNLFTGSVTFRGVK